MYVCSTYDNYGKDACIRNQVDESDLNWFVYGHFSIEEEDITPEFVEENIIKIIADNEKTEIFYSDGKKSIVNQKGLIR